MLIIMNSNIEDGDAELDMKSKSVLKRLKVTKKRAAIAPEQVDNKISRLEQYSSNMLSRNELLQQEDHRTKTLDSDAATMDVLAQLIEQREKNRQRRHQERLQIYQTYQRKCLQQREKSAKIHQQMMERLMQSLLETPTSL